MALPSTKDIQELLELVVQIDLWELVERLVLFPKWEGLNNVINVDNFQVFWKSQLLKQIVGFVVFHVLFELVVSEVPLDVHLQVHHDDGEQHALSTFNLQLDQRLREVEGDEKHKSISYKQWDSGHGEVDAHLSIEEVFHSSVSPWVT